MSSSSRQICPDAPPVDISRLHITQRDNRVYITAYVHITKDDKWGKWYNTYGYADVYFSPYLELADPNGRYGKIAEFVGKGIYISTKKDRIYYRSVDYLPNDYNGWVVAEYELQPNDKARRLSVKYGWGIQGRKYDACWYAVKFSEGSITNTAYTSHPEPPKTQCSISKMWIQQLEGFSTRILVLGQVSCSGNVRLRVSPYLELADPNGRYGKVAELRSYGIASEPFNPYQPFTNKQITSYEGLVGGEYYLPPEILFTKGKFIGKEKGTSIPVKYGIRLRREDGSVVAAKTDETEAINPDAQARLTVTITNERGEPIDDAKFTVYRGGKVVGWGYQSSYRTLTLNPGTYTVRAEAPGYKTKDVTVTLNPGEDKEIKIKLRWLGYVLEVDVFEARAETVGAVPTTATVSIRDGVSKSMTVNRTARVTLPRGIYMVRASKEGYTPAEQQVVLDSNKRVVFVLRPSSWPKAPQPPQTQLPQIPQPSIPWPFGANIPWEWLLLGGAVIAGGIATAAVVPSLIEAQSMRELGKTLLEKEKRGR